MVNMRRLILILMILVMAGCVSAVSLPADSAPKVNIKAYGPGDIKITEVNTDAAIIIEATDEGFDAGISSIQLFDGSAVIARKECKFLIECTLRVNVHNTNKTTRSYRGEAIDAGRHARSDSISVKFLGEQQPPTISAPSELEVEENQKVTFYVLTADRNNDIVTLTMGAPNGASLSGNRFEWTPSHLQSGTYNVKFIAKDNDGSETRNVKIIVKDSNREPTSITFSPQDGSIDTFENGEKKFSVSFQDADSKKPTIKWYLDGKQVSSGKNYTFKPDYDDAGAHNLAVQISDGTFTKRKAWAIAVTNVNREPTISVAARRTVDEGDTVRFAVSASDKDRDSLAYSASGLPIDAAFNQDMRVFTWKTREGDAGTYLVSFQARDSKGGLAAKAMEITVERKSRTRYQTYLDLLKEKELQKRQDAQAIKQQASLTGSQNTANTAPITAKQPCTPGYLCSSVTYG